MSDESWEEQFRHFLRKTGEDFRRASEDVKAEAQRLLDAAMDPQRQQRVRDRLAELSRWAQKTAHGMAGAMEGAASKAETMFQRATEKVTEATGKTGGAQATPSSPRSSPAKPRKAAKKSSGGKAKRGAKPRKKGGKSKG